MHIDLRSDTVTRPSAEMLAFMMKAPLGDDVYGEDPTVNELEKRTAAYFGFEAGMFCPSGTMTNQVAIKTHTIPGDEVICDYTSHVYNYEGGGMAFNSGVQVRAVHGERGRITAKDVLDNIQPEAINLPRTSLVSIENTLNKAGGSFYTLNRIKEISEACKQQKLALHLDGARVFNALIETGENASDYAEYFDSISVCFSKSMGAPVGSVLVGSADFIKSARRYRRLLGGGMRQAGVLAAAALYALGHNISRLKEDHQRAKEIAKVLSSQSYVEELVPVETNIVIFKLKEDMPVDRFIHQLKGKNILANAMGKQTMRFVTHLDFNDEMLGLLKQALSEIKHE